METNGKPMEIKWKTDGKKWKTEGNKGKGVGTLTLFTFFKFRGVRLLITNKSNN